MRLCVYMCLQLVAEDVDSQMNGAILYSIVSGDRDNQFFIDPHSGVIKVNKQLDREKVRAHTHKHKHTSPLVSLEIITDKLHKVSLHYTRASFYR